MVTDSQQCRTCVCTFIWTIYVLPSTDSSYSHILSGSSSPTNTASNTDYDTFPFLADILCLPPEPILPIWEVQLVLDQSQDGGFTRLSDDTTPPKVIVSPSLVDFQEAIEKLLSLYKDVVSSFVPISEDVRVSHFTTVSRFDLLRRIEEEKSEREGLVPGGSLWPNMAALLHEYVPYEDSVTFIRTVLSKTMNEIHRLSKVSIVLLS